MTMTDPIADMLTRVRNANSAHHDVVSMPFSKLKSHIAEILQAEGYIAAWKVEEAEVGKTLTIDLKYGPNRERSIAGVRRVSKPGLRVYSKVTPYVGGMGFHFPCPLFLLRVLERVIGPVPLGLRRNLILKTPLIALLLMIRLVGEK